jgi:hypothetical protein
MRMAQLALKTLIPFIEGQKSPIAQAQTCPQQCFGSRPGVQHLPRPAQQDRRLPRHGEGVGDASSAGALQNRRKACSRIGKRDSLPVLPKYALIPLLQPFTGESSRHERMSFPFPDPTKTRWPGSRYQRPSVVRVQAARPDKPFWGAPMAKER